MRRSRCPTSPIETHGPPAPGSSPKVPTFLSLDALVAERTNDDIVITVQPQENVKRSRHIGMDTIGRTCRGDIEAGCGDRFLRSAARHHRCLPQRRRGGAR